MLLDPNADSPVTIGVDASFLTRDRRGMGRFLRCVLDCWRHHMEHPHRIVLITHQKRHLASLEEYQRDGWEVACSSQTAQLALNVCWFPWNRVDWETACPRVTFIHDVAPFTKYHPDRHRSEDQQRLFEAAERADVVMTNSNFSRVEIHRHLGCPLDAIEVVYLAYDDSLFRPLAPGASIPRLPAGLRWHEYLLFIGNLEPRKNLQGLLEALALARKDVTIPLALLSPKPTLHWTEKLRGKHDALVDLCDSLGDQLIWLEGANDQELVALYQGARLFVMPSFYEGFGLPLLEAIACGTPCAAAKAASLPEVGGSLPLWFNPREPVDMARVLMEGVRQPPPDLELFRKQAENFSWKRAAELILDCLVATARKPPRRSNEASIEFLAAFDEDEREEPGSRYG